MIEYRCPSCGSTILEVAVELSVTVSVKLIQSADGEPRVLPLTSEQIEEVRDRFGSWDSESYTECLKCGTSGEAWTFRNVAPQPED
jgi:hypothetical protein